MYALINRGILLKSLKTRTHTAFGLYYTTRQSSVLVAVDKLLQLSTSNPIYQSTAGLLQYVHDATGLPWWMSIVATTVGIRLLVHSPLMIAAQKNQARLSLLKKDIDKEIKEVERAVRHAKWVYKLSDTMFQESMRNSLKQSRKKIYETHNVHPLKSGVVMLTQIPIWLALSLTLRSMAGYYGCSPIDGFLTEGGLWFPNLLQPDPILILPLLLGGLTIANMKFGQLVSPLSSSLDPRLVRMEKKTKRVIYALAAALVPLAAVMPSCLSLYWVTSSSFSLLQYALFSVPSVRRTAGIPKYPQEPDITKLFRRKEV